MSSFWWICGCSVCVCVSAIDRNKYNANEIITGSIDHTIRLWVRKAVRGCPRGE